jgi:hypothetical protein
VTQNTDCYRFFGGLSAEINVKTAATEAKHDLAVMASDLLPEADHATGYGNNKGRERRICNLLIMKAGFHHMVISRPALFALVMIDRTPACSLHLLHNQTAPIQ